MNGRASGEVRYRAVPLGGSLKAHFAPQADGSVIVTSTEPLLPYAARITDRFLHWAEAAPDRTLVAKRLNGGDWRRVTYGEALINARSIAQALLDHGLSAERPLAIDKFQGFLEELSPNVFRGKGLLWLDESETRYVLHLVGRRFTLDEDRAAQPRAKTKLVLIGQNLDHELLRSRLEDCLV